MKSRNSLFIYAPVVVAMICWSFSFIWYKKVFLFYQPVTVIVLRLVIAVPLLFVLSVLTGKLQRINMNHLKWFMTLGFFEPFLYFMGECYGMQYITPTLGSILVSLIPLLAPIPARILFRERFGWMNYTGLFISLAGVLLVIAGEGSTGSFSMAGVLLMLVAVISTLFHSVYVRKLAPFYSSFTIVTYQSTFGLLYLLPVFYFTEFHTFLQLPHTPESFVPVIELAIFASTLAFLMFVYSIKQIGIARTNVFVNLIPVLTAVLSFFILHENFGTAKITGVAVVIGGLIFSQFQRKTFRSR